MILNITFSIVLIALLVVFLVGGDRLSRIDECKKQIEKLTKDKEDIMAQAQEDVKVLSERHDLLMERCDAFRDLLMSTGFQYKDGQWVKPRIRVTASQSPQAQPAKAPVAQKAAAPKRKFQARPQVNRSAPAPQPKRPPADLTYSSADEEVPHHP